MQIKEEAFERQTLFPCDACQLAFSKKTTRDAHRQHYCLESARHVTPLDLSKPKASVSKQIYSCDFCSIRFSSLKVLRAHQENYCLDKCRSVSLGEERLDSFVWFSRAWRRYRSWTGSEVLLRCTICSAMFDGEETLFSHMKGVHANVDLIECLACRSRFCSEWNLLRHLRLSHTNIKEEKDRRQIKRFACSFCSIRFVSFVTLKQHMAHYCCSRPAIDKTDPCK